MYMCSVPISQLHGRQNNCQINVKVLHVLIVESAITGSAFMVLLISDAVTVTEDKNGQSLRTF